MTRKTIAFLIFSALCSFGVQSTLADEMDISPAEYQFLPGTGMDVDWL